MNNRLIICLITILQFQTFLAQEGEVYFRDITMEDGLSHNSVICIEQDNQGFMWFGTIDGLNRYDGYHVKIYKNDPNDPESISHNYVTSIFEDSRGVLWIGTGFRGLNRYDKEQDKFISYRLDVNDSTSISSDHFIKALYEDKQGHLWIGTFDGLNKYDAENDQFIRYTNTIVDSSGIRPEFITCILEDSKDNFWLGTKGGGLFLFNRKNRKAIRFKHNPNNPGSLNNNFIYSIFEDNNGELWVGTDNGYSRFRFSEDGIIFEQDRKGIPPTISSKKAFDLYGRTGSIKLIKAVQQVDFIDNQGNIWIGTLYGGVKFYNTAQNAFHTYKYQQGNPDGLKNSSVMALYERTDGNLWIGVDHGGLHLYNRKENSFTHYPLDPQKPDNPFDENVTAIEEDSYGNLWVGTWTNGIYKINEKSGRSIHYKPEVNNPSSLNCPILYTIYEDSRQNIWIGTYGKGLSLYDRKNDGFIPSSQIYKHFVRKFYEDSQKNLWVCTAPGLILLDRDSMTFKEWSHDPNNKNSLSHRWISFVFEDSRSDLWVGTYYGLNLFDRENDTFKAYFVEDGLPDNFMAGIAEDDKGYLWLSTNRGISKFDPVNETFKNYDVNDGLQGTLFNMNAYAKLKTGEIIFGGTNGFTLFHPDSIKDIERIPPVVITDFQIFNKPLKPNHINSPLQKSISLTDEITLPYHQHSISFEFAVLDYINPKNNHYKYMLEGFNKDWIEIPADRRIATFTNLRPGTYIFRVIGANSKDIWNPEGDSVKIIITPPWWKTKSAYIFYVLLTAFIVWLLWKEQMRRVQIRQELQMKQFETDKLHELDQMKSQFFANISHEIRTPLTLILGPLEQLISEAAKEKWKNPLKIMSRNARNLLGLINQLLDFSKLESGKMTLKAKEINIVPLLKGMVYSFDSLAKRKQITLAFASEKEVIPVYIDTEKLEKIMANLLSNAFKFTSEGGKISVQLFIVEQERKTVEIHVTDTGIGIAAEHLNHIFERYYHVDDKNEQTGTGIGLALTRELVELHHGRISVQSEPGKGSVFIIQLPLGQEHLNPDEMDLEKERELPPLESVQEQIDSTVEEPEKAPDDRIETAKKKKELPVLLIVEDTEDVRNYMKGFLAPYYQIKEAQDGEDGFEKAVETIPDLVISDVMMPKMDGFQLCEKLKTDERTSHIPVILLTARAAEASKLEGLETGADDYLIKPFNSKELTIRIRNLIDQRQKLRERFTRDITLSPKDISVTSADERFLNRAIEIIEKHMSDPDFGVDVFGKKIALSHSQLHRKIRALTNQSPVEFIRTLRLKHAASLLEQAWGNVAEISYEVGFNNPSYFAECFRKQYGKSPSEYTA